ncbi:hypothetical protein [Leptospira ilyithenensis]|uniref:DUF4912 domain-containing protein n=1 Tax=Leptospira ilyithenensis TaxID=2484901 RepID=A0A4R9LQM3_9LEPT|nr:hypothetical protein [Leptospira ilyithenensis]TGN11748.1 hypothetical protein EHS11_06580 [Leptospira ilyithenensis]
MADPDSKKPSPKKKTTAGKKTVSTDPIEKIQTTLKTTSPGYLIYNDPKFLKPIPPVEKDLVKVLVRNPKEAFVFWNFDPERFSSLPIELGAPSMEQVHFKLRVQYKKESGFAEDWHDLSAFTSSYYCKWDVSVKEINASLFAFFGEKSFFCLETKTGDLPKATESFLLDEKWIHPNWAESGWIKKIDSGHWVFSETYLSAESEKSLQNPGILGGSSGFGSHSHISQ